MPVDHCDSTEVGNPPRLKSADVIDDTQLVFELTDRPGNGPRPDPLPTRKSIDH
jgi:hypothetical protein